MWWLKRPACRPRPRPRPLRARAASIRFLLATRAGRLTQIDGVTAARQLPGVVEVGLTCEIGQEVVLRQSFRDRLGYVIATAQEGAAAARAAEAGLDVLRARIAAVTLIAEACG